MPKKNNQRKRNYLLTSKQQYTVSNSSHSIWRTTTKKNGKKNLKLVFHLSVSPTTIHVVKLIPCLTSKQNDDKQTQKWRLLCHLTTDDPDMARHTSYHLSSQDKTKKFLNDTRETSLLTALLFSQFALSSCLRTAHSEHLCC